MRRNWVIGGMVVAIVAALLVGAQIWVPHPGPSGGANSTVTSALTGGGATSKAGSSTSTKGTPPPSPAHPSSRSGVAAVGAALAPLTHAPEKTIAGFDAGYFPVNGRYLVTFRPFGFGPASQGQATLVVKIVSAQGLGGATGSKKLVGVTTLARMSPTSVTAYSKGATYTAELSFSSDSRGLVPRLSPPLSPQAAKKMTAASQSHPKK